MEKLRPRGRALDLVAGGLEVSLGVLVDTGGGWFLGLPLPLPEVDLLPGDGPLPGCDAPWSAIVATVVI